ncbi:archease [Candidatus Pacearchaeota archaeon]|nr:archease [Candidatus Pacearchaeota archaeon]
MKPKDFSHKLKILGSRKQEVFSRYKFLEHTADVKFQAYGKSLEEAFANSALAMKEVICGKIEVAGKIIKKIKVSGKDNEALLYNFLEEFLFLLDSEEFLLSEIERIKISGKELEAEVSGDKAGNYDFSNDVKAVTYNSMFVKKVKDKFIIQAVLDV